MVERVDELSLICRMKMVKIKVVYKVLYSYV